MSLEKIWVQCECVKLSRWKWQKNDRKGEMRRRVAVCGRPRGRAIMADRRRRKTWSNENVEDGDRARMVNRARRMNMKMRRNNLKFFVSPNWMSDNCGSVPAKTTLRRERAIDKRSNAKEAFKFIVSPNRGIWVILPVKNPLIRRYFEEFLLSLTVEFVVKTKIMKIENKHMTAMFAAFQSSRYETGCPATVALSNW